MELDQPRSHALTFQIGQESPLHRIDDVSTRIRIISGYMCNVINIAAVRDPRWKPLFVKSSYQKSDGRNLERHARMQSPTSNTIDSLEAGRDPLITLLNVSRAQYSDNFVAGWLFCDVLEPFGLCSHPLPLDRLPVFLRICRSMFRHKVPRSITETRRFI